MIYLVVLWVVYMHLECIVSNKWIQWERISLVSFWFSSPFSIICNALWFRDKELRPICIPLRLYVSYIFYWNKEPSKCLMYLIGLLVIWEGYVMRMWSLWTPMPNSQSHKIDLISWYMKYVTSIIDVCVWFMELPNR